MCAKHEANTLAALPSSLDKHDKHPPPSTALVDSYDRRANAEAVSQISLFHQVIGRIQLEEGEKK